jgi:trans-aconitate 2-methyltransferase
VIDLGCGSGAVAPALRERLPGRRLVGVDAAPAMLDEAGRRYDATIRADIAEWVPARPPAVIFSNASLNWVPDHAVLLPRLLKALVRGGWLAVQVPDQQARPSHRLIGEVAGALFPDRFGRRGPAPHVLPPDAYAGLLPEADIWRTEYFHRLPADDGAHPVRRFTEGAAARPVLSRLGEPDRARFLVCYDEALAAAYPPEADGTVLFPFARLFLVARA